MEVIPFVCPLCKGPVEFTSNAYHCSPCGREYPIICGIPDFRILPDRYISLEDDRRKGEWLFAEAGRRSFAEMLDFYYSITPEVPRQLARKFTAHALAETAIADQVLDEIGAWPAPGSLLDVGCSTGGLVVAAARRLAQVGQTAVIGLDVAFRWLVVGTARLREAGVQAPLVCGNAEYLPFPPDSFAAVTCTDVVEHLIDPAPAFRECRRVAAPGGVIYVSTNNRYALTPEPHTNVWGVGLVPRAMQTDYVRFVSGREYRNITLRTARELDRWAQAAGFVDCRARPAPIVGASLGSGLSGLVALYNRVRRLPPASGLLRWIGPRLELTCRK
jgi:ubiquinone/menaquinone biosynthesis C-methylase UbiE/uncharacterized protein YbaR (Trm112 family)